MENFNERKNMKEKPLNFFPTFKASLLDIKEGMTRYGKIVFVKREWEQLKSPHNQCRIYRQRYLHYSNNVLNEDVEISLLCVLALQWRRLDNQIFLVCFWINKSFSFWNILLIELSKPWALNHSNMHENAKQRENKKFLDG